MQLLVPANSDPCCRVGLGFGVSERLPGDSRVQPVRSPCSEPVRAVPEMTKGLDPGAHPWSLGPGSAPSH